MLAHAAEPSALTFPGLQRVQKVLPVPLAYHPGSQGRHAGIPLAFEKKPAAQGRHEEAFVAAAIAPYAPDGHAVHESEEGAAQEPCAQHVAAPSELLKPLSQARQPLRAFTPVVLWKVFAGQGVQDAVLRAKRVSL